MRKKRAPKKELTLAAAEALIRRMKVGRGRLLEIRPTMFLGWSIPATKPKWARLLEKDLRSAWDRQARRDRA